MKQFLLLMLLPALALAEDSSLKNYAAYGELLIPRLTNAPFPHPSRVRGYTYDRTNYFAAQHYQDSRVALFIPKGFKHPAEIDFVVHFHGWRATIGRVLQNFHLVEQFTASERNAILVIPQGPLDAPDSSGGKLEDPGGFARFMDEVLATLRPRTGFQDACAGRIVLSGHSGGYRVISSILDTGGLTNRIREIFLFDALYGQSDKFLAWIDREKDARLVAIYTKDGGTLKETQKFLNTLRTKKFSYLARQEGGTTTEQLRQNRLVFLYSDQGHNEVLSQTQNFRDWLAVSGLAARSTAR